jgi:tetratricopeptide (TPR) repeat protein
MRSLFTVVTILIATAASADQVSSARQHFQKGTTLYELSKFHEAAAEYEQAYQAKPDPALLFNIGQAYRLAGEQQAALRSYRSYLRKVPDATNRAEVEGYIERLQKAIDEQKTAPPVAPAPVPAPAPPPTTTVAAPSNQALVASPAPPAERKPVYKQWWLWTAVGVVVAGGAVGLAVAFTTPHNASGPANTVPVGLQ